MQSEISRLMRRTACAGSLALAVFAGLAHGATRVDSILASWPENSRLTARALVERYGAPRKADDAALIWYGPGAWKRTVLHRSEADGNILEQVVDYRVPERRIDDMRAFDGRVLVDRKAGELYVRSDRPETNFLLANLADEVAGGFKSVDDARSFYDRQVRLSEAGKSSSYRDSLRFEQPSPATVQPWIGFGPDWSAPFGKPWDTRGTPWIVPAGTRLPSASSLP